MLAPEAGAEVSATARALASGQAPELVLASERVLATELVSARALVREAVRALVRVSPLRPV